MTVEFRLLGEVEARVDGRRLDIGHARQRCVLTALLVDVNQRIPAEQLVDRVWSGQPPDSARNALSTYVSRLRNLLACAQDVRISRERHGYVLVADALSLDLYRFRCLVSQARATADPLQAAELFDRALDIWGGEPFASLDTSWLNDLRSALVAEHFTVTLDRNDAALSAGRHGELLVELSTALAAYRLDERLAGQLMLAQYRCGRQADALETYRQMRRRLVEELAIDPGPGLRQLHQQILAGDVEDHAGDRSAAAVARGVLVFDRPHSVLLRRTTSFVNHTQELAQVIDALREGPLVTLTGVGGVGKTRLAVEVARRQQERFTDGVAICELAALDHGEALGHTVAVAVGLRQQQGLDIEVSVIEYLRAREVLLVIDNCEHVLDAAAKLLGRIVRQCPRVSVLATSRQPLGLEGERIVVVPPLAVEDATRLFADRARISRPDFDLEQQPVGAVAEICQRVDCLPLGVELAAARMRMMSSSDVARRLDQLRMLRGGVRGALPRQQSLSATIDWSYRLLTDSEQALFVRLSAFAGGFDLEAAHGVCGADGACEDDTLELLAGLVDKSMVMVRSVTARTRYGVLGLVRAFGRERLREQGTENHYASRHALYYIELAERAAVGLHGAEERDWVERMLPDHDNLRAAFERAMADDDIDLALRLVTSASELIGIRVGYEVAGWAERAVAVADPDHRLYPTAVGTAARGAWTCGDFSRARHLAALADGRVPGRGSPRLCYPGDVLVDAAMFEGDTQHVLAYWEREAARARYEGDPIRLVWTAFSSAIHHGVLGVPDAALPAAQEAVEVADTTGNPTARSMAEFALGFLLKKSEPERALGLFDQAAQLAAEVQNFWWYGIALLEQAATRAVHGDPATAASMFIRVLDHWDRVGDWTQQWGSLRHIARLLVRLGADDDALFLQWAAVKAGKPPPLSADQLGVLVDRVGADRFQAYGAPNLLAADAATAVARARSSLQRHVTRQTEPAP